MVRTRFENLRVYQLAEEIADPAWGVVIKWERLPQDTISRQLINSPGSIGANIAKGAGHVQRTTTNYQRAVLFRPFPFMILMKSQRIPAVTAESATLNAGQ